MRLRQTIMDSATEKLSVQASRRSAVLRAIESRSADPKLRAGAVAGLLGITPRYVHLLLEETGRSFTQHLLEVRLRKAKVLLCDPCWHQRKIGDVALESGFADLSYFSRTFRRRYGATPTAVRERAREDRAPQ
jgi:AraC-like DNA-binding protein